MRRALWVMGLVGLTGLAFAQSSPTDIFTQPGTVLGSAAALAAWVVTVVNVLKKFLPIEGMATVITAYIVAIVTGIVAGAFEFVVPSITAGLSLGIAAGTIAVGAVGELRSNARATADALSDKLGGLPE